VAIHRNSFVRHFAGRVCDDYQGNDATCCDRHPRRTGRYLHNSNAERASIGNDARQCDAQQGIIIPSYLLHEGIYLPGSSVIPSNAEAMAAGNVILGGVIGLGVDAATGAMNHYSDLVTVAMVPDQSCYRPAAPVPAPGRHSS